MASSTLSQIEENIERLSPHEQMCLAERIFRRLKRNVAQRDVEERLAAMAADPEIQNELRAIDREFAASERDGLKDSHDH